MALKVYATTIMCTSDEARALGLNTFHRQAWGVVAAPNRKAAARAFGISDYHARGFMSETGNAADIATAMAAPGMVFARPMHDNNKAAIQIKRAA